MASKSDKQQKPIKASELGGDAPRTVVVSGAGVDDGPDDDDADEELQAGEPVPPPPELPRAAAPVLPAPPVVQHAVPFQPRVIYKADTTRHMSEMGPVATRNFTAVIRGTRVDVKFGAPRKRIPREVVELMERSGVEFGHASPPPGQGAAVVTRPKRTESPRARRTERRAEDAERGFRKVQTTQSIAAQQAY